MSEYLAGYPYPGKGGYHERYEQGLEGWILSHDVGLCEKLVEEREGLFQSLVVGDLLADYAWGTLVHLLPKKKRQALRVVTLVMEVPVTIDGGLATK